MEAILTKGYQAVSYMEDGQYKVQVIPYPWTPGCPVMIGSGDTYVAAVNDLEMGLFAIKYDFDNLYLLDAIK